ncbi:MAG: hypothetical protein MJ113_02540 [Lachnospiraceae bacterium]|nr:hypothetical protein [Lachnospiraceae bacterium]
MLFSHREKQYLLFDGYIFSDKEKIISVMTDREYKETGDLELGKFVLNYKTKYPLKSLENETKYRWKEVDASFPFIAPKEDYIYAFDDSLAIIDSSLGIREFTKGYSIRYGKVFNELGTMMPSEAVLVRTAEDNLFIVASELKLRTSGVVTPITTESFVSFYDTFVRVGNISEDAKGNMCFSVHNIKISDEWQIELLERRYFYKDVYEYLKVLTNENLTNRRMSVADDFLAQMRPKMIDELQNVLYSYLYQDVLGYRVEYDESFSFVEREGALTLKQGEMIQKLENNPLYYLNDGKRGLYLPVPYCLAIPEKSMMFSFYLATEIEKNGDSILAYLKSGILGDDKTQAVELLRGFLFDGDNIYVTLTEAVVRFGNSEIPLSRLSTVEVEEDGSLYIYDFEKDESKVYHISNRDIKLDLGNDRYVDLKNDLVYDKGKISLILGDNPSLLPSYEK